ncbi:LysR family transcriptional regulator [Actinomadura sp. NBRC 104412]|uniref:LysR family transcriptional regulator n=1 Tax=Actinomadura sp. NBRC 104412 TaxID=3032203 RepID=UPI0024A46DEB|nr:LysR family transcriptional regulator [Actinomadura sp. NBRC 104412]GLZ07870.1 LysR family transcriptional regulator [Actinomadura sp. NBRC 104412]
MDVRQLEYFLAVVDNGGFNRAAGALFMAQPSLSQAIRTLEKDLGTSLFHRTGRRVVLTEAGKALIGPARQAVRSLEVARESVNAAQGLRTGRITIASMPSPAIEPLSTMIQNFARRHPGVDVVLRDAPVPGAVIEMVRNGVTELGLLSDWERPTAPEVDLHHVERQKLVVVAPADGPFAPGPPLPRERLAGQRLIAGERGTGMRRLVEEIRASGVDVPIAVETDHRVAILSLVLKGVGVAILAEAWVPLALRAGAVVRDLDPPATLDLALVSRKGWLSPVAEEFLTMAKTSAAERPRR